MNLFRGWFANIVFRGLVCSVKLISGKTVVNSELLYRAQLEKVIPSVHERKHGDIYASIHLWAWRPALFVARPDHDKMWQYDVEPCCCISLQIKLVKTWISFCCCMQSHSNCAMLRGQRSFVGNQNESRDYTDCGCWWFVLVCWFIKAFTLSESCSGRSFPGLRIYMLSSTCIILTYFRFVFPQPQNNEQTVSHSRLISKQDHKALKQKMS